MPFIKKLKLALLSLYREIILHLPDEYSKFRVNYYNKNGCSIHQRVSISPNVRMRGLVRIGEGSSIAQNASITGMSAGVIIGNDVMVAPNVVIVAFSHGTSSTSTPMAKQECIESPVYIEDDVWIGANVTISMGVVIGKGSIIGANSFVNQNINPYSIAAGTPARTLKSRLDNA